MADPLADIALLTDAVFRAEQARLSALAAEEARLRQALRDLDDHHRQSRSLPVSELTSLRQLGADILWQAWIGRNKQSLNIELAQVLAQKSRVIRGLRQAFGRREAARTLACQADEATDRKRLKSRLDQIETLQMLKQAAGTE